MFPPLGVADQPVNEADAFDIPVFVRHSSPLTAHPRPRPKQVDYAVTPWPPIRDIPPPGAYLITTTWRDIIDAAGTVGRDPVPWFAAMPSLAWREIMARCSPLMAYLHREPSVIAHPGSSGYLLKPNAVYNHGTENTARGAFGYRIGMTMAEWVCRGLMGLGPTFHAEARQPGSAGPAWSPTGRLPDLVGDHWRAPATWLVEAKGARRVGARALAKGVTQLTVMNLMSGDHVRVLCGASLEPRLFVTVDVEVLSARAPWNEPPILLDPAADDTVLVDLARSRMLTYYSLRALPAEALTVRPIGPAVADQGSRLRWIGLVYPLEQDLSTAEERALAQNPVAYDRFRPLAQRIDMLTGRVPGTNILIGMSRRLFEACRDLDEEDAQIAEEFQMTTPDLFGGEEELEEYTRERRAALVERDATRSPRMRAAVRQGFERGRGRSWQQILDRKPEVTSSMAADLLESATTDTYLAIERSPGLS